MRVDVLNIIAGLEDAFNNAVSQITHRGVLSLKAHNPTPARRSYISSGAPSIIRSLGHSYHVLNQDRRQAWSDYAKPLGISPRNAYIQHNYSRVAQGVEAERWPPVYVGNKVKNFDMFGNPPQYWTLGPGGFFLGNGHLSISSGNFASDTLACKQDLTLLPNTDYEVSFEIHTYGNATGFIKFGLGSDLYAYDMSFNYPEGERVSYTFTTPSSGGFLNIPVVFYTNGDNYKTYINNVSVIEV